jgi:hypothetical protein
MRKAKDSDGLPGMRAGRLRVPFRQGGGDRTLPDADSPKTAWWPPEGGQGDAG